MEVILEIIIPGRPISGNHAKVPTENGRQVRSRDSREYDARIASIAKAAVVSAGWVIPDYVNVDVILFNTRLDRENATKELHDPLQGIVFSHDSRILDGRTKKIKDDYGPRVILHISAVNGSDYGYANPRSQTLSCRVKQTDMPELMGDGRTALHTWQCARNTSLMRMCDCGAYDNWNEQGGEWMGDTGPSLSASEAKRRTDRKHALDTALIPSVSFAERDEWLRKARR